MKETEDIIRVVLSTHQGKKQRMLDKARRERHRAWWREARRASRLVRRWFGCKATPVIDPMLGYIPVARAGPLYFRIGLDSSWIRDGEGPCRFRPEEDFLRVRLPGDDYFGAEKLRCLEDLAQVLLAAGYDESGKRRND
jgi:hypothetical protein